MVVFLGMMVFGTMCFFSWMNVGVHFFIVMCLGMMFLGLVVMFLGLVMMFLGMVVFLGMMVFGTMCFFSWMNVGVHFFIVMCLGMMFLGLVMMFLGYRHH